MAGRFGKALQRRKQTHHGLPDHDTSGNRRIRQRRRNIVARRLWCTWPRADVSIANDRLASAQGSGTWIGAYCDDEGGAAEFEDVFGVLISSSKVRPILHWRQIARVNAYRELDT